MPTVDSGVVVLDEYEVRIRDNRPLLLDFFEFLIKERIPTEHSGHNGNGTGFFVFEVQYKQAVEAWLKERINRGDSRGV